jgi:hypothetical protein
VTGLPCQGGGRATRPCGKEIHGRRQSHTSFMGEVGVARCTGKEIHGESGSHRDLTERLREEGASACRGGGDVGPRSMGESERGEGEETERL